MANMIDYLDWRGDLSLSQSPFNDVDSLILCQLVYMKFDNVLTEDRYHQLTVLSDAVKTLLTQLDGGETLADNLIPNTKYDRRFLAALASSRRFGPMHLTRYVNRIDYEEQKQFSAFTVLTGDSCAYVAFRGTDDTLIGWKEDFNMSFMTPVPAQKEAVEYLESVAADYPESFRVGGHSKGGNLAVYASAFCDPAIQDWILNVYSNDGPGFDGQVLKSEGYGRIRKRIHTFVPQSSIIGMLLEHEESYTVIHSTEVGLMQHDPYSWEVCGPDFIRLETVDEGSRLIDETLHAWISGIDYSQKEKFVDALYNLLTASEFKSTAEFTKEGLKSIATLLKTMTHLDDGTRKLILSTMTSLFRCAKDIYRKKNPHPLYSWAENGKADLAKIGQAKTEHRKSAQDPSI